MNQNQNNDPHRTPGNPQQRDEDRRQELPGRQGADVPAQTAATPGEPEGSGDNLEREPNQRPHDLDFHQSEDFTGKGVKGAEEERQRHENAA